jgi:hypothetical protein
VINTSLGLTGDPGRCDCECKDEEHEMVTSNHGKEFVDLYYGRW